MEFSGTKKSNGICSRVRSFTRSLMFQYEDKVSCLSHGLGYWCLFNTVGNRISHDENANCAH